MRVELRLCDEEGLVSRQKAIRPERSVSQDETYIERLNRLKSEFSATWPENRYDGEPFHCTGSATFPNLTVVCDNPIHHPAENQDHIVLDQN